MFAVAKLGAVLVPLNPRLTGPDLQYTLRHSEAVAAITAATLGDVDFLQLFEDLLVQLPDLQYLITVGEENLWYDDRIFQCEDLLSAGGGRDYQTGPIAPEDDLFAILYTSGTTGKPKGVELTHANILGVGPGVLGSLISGSALILQDEYGSEGSLDLIERHGATVHYGVPALFATELREQQAQPRDVSSLRVRLVAGGRSRSTCDLSFSSPTRSRRPRPRFV